MPESRMVFVDCRDREWRGDAEATAKQGQLVLACRGNTERFDDVLALYGFRGRMGGPYLKTRLEYIDSGSAPNVGESGP